MSEHRKIVPIRTKSGLQIGSLWTPKPCARRASAVEIHTAPRRPYVKWAAWCLFGAVCFALLVER